MPKYYISKEKLQKRTDERYSNGQEIPTFNDILDCLEPIEADERCVKCNGVGKVLSLPYAVAPDSVCSYCNGTGKEPIDTNSQDTIHSEKQCIPTYEEIMDFFHKQNAETLALLAGKEPRKEECEEKLRIEKKYGTDVLHELWKRNDELDDTESKLAKAVQALNMALLYIVDDSVDMRKSAERVIKECLAEIQGESGECACEHPDCQDCKPQEKCEHNWKLIKEAEERYGKRCPEYDEDCAGCRIWEMLDKFRESGVQAGVDKAIEAVPEEKEGKGENENWDIGFSEGFITARSQMLDNLRKLRV